MLEEAFGEVGRGIEAYQKTDFVDPVFSGSEQLGTFVEPDELDIVVGRQSRDALDFLLEVGAADRELARKTVDREFFVGHIVEYECVQLSDKFGVFRLVFFLFEVG